MAGGLDVDLDCLDAISGRLARAADALDAAGGSVPGLPDAGDVSGIMGAAIAHLTESAGNLVIGLAGAGEEVSAARRDYAARDQSSADSLRGY
ncbi:hypothetical protein [Actinoplanes xinjiangensis]|uniref:hypothetical protein n=1 Tax=Actinoplanes xinjiangensis TaxID=512350 RepID=UPI00343277B0